MIDGLWIVQYEATTGGDGGVIVFVQGQVLGGDNAYTYTGTYHNDDKTVSARVVIHNFNPAVPNVLGIDGDFELVMRGTIEDGIIKGAAGLINRAGPGLALKLTKVADLAV